MTRNWIALGACLLMLAGCAKFASRQTFPRHYTLAASSSPAHESTQPASRMALHLARINAPPWLQDTELYYRLDYSHDDRIAAYAQSDWVAPPAGLLEPLIRNAIAGGAGWRIVTGPGDTAKADFNLDIRLDDFSQVFTSPRQSHGVLDATATLVDNRNGNAAAQKHFHFQASAPSANAAGGVKALNRVALQFSAALAQWLHDVQRTLPANTPEHVR